MSWTLDPKTYICRSQKLTVCKLCSTRVITLQSRWFNKGNRRRSVEINSVSKTTFACSPDMADKEMKMTFSLLFVENKGREGKGKKKMGNMWNDELDGGVFIKHHFCLCARVVMEKCWWCKTQQAQQGDGRSRVFCVIYCFRLRKNKTTTLSKILLLGK